MPQGGAGRRKEASYYLWLSQSLSQLLSPLPCGLPLWSAALICYREGGTLPGGGLTEGGDFARPLPSEDFGNSFHALIP